MRFKRFSVGAALLAGLSGCASVEDVRLPQTEAMGDVRFTRAMYDCRRLFGTSAWTYVTFDNRDRKVLVRAKTWSDGVGLGQLIPWSARPAHVMEEVPARRGFRYEGDLRMNDQTLGGSLEGQGDRITYRRGDETVRCRFERLGPRGGQFADLPVETG